MTLSLARDHATATARAAQLLWAALRHGFAPRFAWSPACLLDALTLPPLLTEFGAGMARGARAYYGASWLSLAFLRVLRVPTNPRSAPIMYIEKALGELGAASLVTFLEVPSARDL